MKRPAVFFDRDNTLIANDGYLGDPTGVVLIDGAADAIARARALGYATVVISNQSGVGRGMFTEEAVHAVNAQLDEMLRRQNPHAVIDRHEFCPYHPEATIDNYRCDSDLRKPKPGMILAAAEKLALDLSRSWFIGDASRDIEAGKAAGCRTILFNDPKLAASPAATLPESAEPDFIANTLGAAIGYIEQHPIDATDDGPASSGDEDTVVSSTGDQISAALAPTTVREAPPTESPGDASPRSTARLEELAQQILIELRRRHEVPQTEFSVSKLLAGITQVLVVAVLFFAYLNRDDALALLNTLIFALVLQTTTIALLIMTRQK